MNSICKIFLGLPFFVLLPYLIVANEPIGSEVTYLGVEQGLSNNDINCLFQSRSGYLWIGTSDGLNRYDGNEVTTIRKSITPKNGLPSNRIVDIQEDHANNIVVSTPAGVTIYDPIRKNFQPVTFKNHKKQTIRLNEQAVLEKNSMEELFVGTKSYGLLLYIDSKKLATQIPLLINNKAIFNYSISDIHISLNGNTWILIQEKGIAQYDAASGKLKLVHAQSQQGNCLIEDAQGNFIIGTDEGISTLDHQFATISVQKTEKEVINLNVLANNEVWASTDGSGILIRHPGKSLFQHEEKFGSQGVFSSNSIKEVLVDRDNNYWIATVRGGVNILHEQKKIFKPVHLLIEKNGKRRDPYISSFCEVSDQEIWVGTDGFGLFQYHQATGQFRKLNIANLKSNHITSMVKDQNGNIWVATWSGGVHRLPKGANEFQNLTFSSADHSAEPKNIWKLYLDRAGHLWASAYGEEGLFKWDEKQQTFQSYAKDLKNVLTFAEDTHGNLWMGSDDYLIRHHLSSKKNQFFKFGFSVRAILPDKDQKLWIGTEGAGLLYFDNSNGKYRVYDESLGFSNNNILNILTDKDGNLWCTTFNGLNKFNRKSKRIIKFSESDGLQNNRFNYLAALKLSSGELVFGGTKGFNLFAAESVEVPTSDLAIQITGIKINGVAITDPQNWLYVKKINDGQIRSLELPYDKGFLSISYSSFDFVKDTDLQFQVLLEGLAKEWVALGNLKTINYSRLPAGDYRLHIRAMGRDNKVQQATVLDIHVSPPWYWNKISVFGYLLFAFFTVFIYLKISKNRTRLQYEAKLANLQKEKEKEFGEKKLQFFTQTLQELKTPITMVINPLKELLNSGVLENDKNLLLANRNANRLLVLTEQFEVLKNQKSPVKIPSLAELDILALLINEFDSFKQLAKDKSVALSVYYDASELRIFANQQKIELIFFNLILNAIEHVQVGGKVVIAVKELNEKILISVTDDADPILKNVDGIDLFDFYNKLKQDTGSIRIELLMVYQMVKEHYGDLKWQSSSAGNKITVELHKGDWFSQYLNESQDQILKSSTTRPLTVSKEILKEQSNPILLSNKNSILIVEDDLELMNYLKDIFSQQYIIYEATDSSQALNVIDTLQPNLILMEVFADKSGYDLCKKLKEDQNFMHLPIVLISASSSNEDQLKSISVGAEEFIIKPFNQDLLKAKVQTIFDSRNILQQYFLDHLTLKDSNSNISLTNKEFLDGCIAIIESNLNNSDFNATLLAVKANMSYSNLYKKVKQFTGLPISSFIRAIRLKQAAVLMLSTENTIHEIAYKVGIQDIKYFREKFKEIYGLTPSNYIKKYRSIYNKDYSIIKK